MANSTSRIAWIDNVKMVAMLFVILGHTWRIIHCPLPEWLGFFLLSFNMALFVVMTGYTSVNAIDRIDNLKSLWDYIFKITKRILVPSAVFDDVLAIILRLITYMTTGELSIKMLIARIVLLLFFIVAYYIRNNKKGQIIFNAMCLLAIPISIMTSSYWFFNMIWCVCTSVAVASFLLKKAHMEKFIFLYLLSFVVSLGVSYLYNKTSDFVHFFLIGYAFRKYKIIDKIENIVSIIISIILGISLISILGKDTMNFWEYHFKEMLLNGSVHLYLLRIIASAIICIFFILLTKKLSGNYNKFSFWGAQSLPLYLVHGMIVSFCFLLPINYTIEGVLYLVYAIPMTTLLTVVSMIIIKFFMKYGITRVYFLGDNN